MLIHTVSRWLLLIFMIILLHACGGGAFEEGVSESESLATTNNDITSISASHLSLQQILPSGGSTTVSFTTLIADEARFGEIAPNIPLKISVHPSGAAKLENVPRSTDHNGDIRFTVSHPGSGDVVLNISGSGSIKKGFDIPLYFGASVLSEILGDSTAPANGTTPLYIRVLTRNWAGVGIPDISVGFSFSLNSSAVLVPLLDDDDQPISTTDITGEFIAGITNTIPQTTKVTPFAGGMSAGSMTLTFGASNVVTTPDSLHLVVKSNNVPANGATSATLVVIARDASGTPVPHIPVHISSDSATAQLNINDEKYGTLFINGNTGEEGRFELKITNTVEEAVNITATTTNGDEIETATSQTIVFENPENVPDSDVKVANIELETKNNSQPANTDPVYLRGRILDEAGNPIANKTVSIIVSGGSAQIELANNGSTDESGRFSATLTDNFAETFKAKATSGGVSSNEVDVIFTAAKSTEAGGDAVPHSITVFATPEQQIAGSGDISLTAIVRDSSNTPISDVLLTLSATGAAAKTLLFDSNTVTTESSGIATFTVSNTVSGTVTILVTATGGVGTISESKSVTFISADEGDTGDTRVNVTRLDIHVVQNSQPANGEAAIRVDVLAKDNNNRPVKEAPLVVQMSAGLAAKADPARTVTEDNGFFTTNITSTEAGEITVSVAVEGTSVVSESRTIKFVAIAPGSEDATPVTVELEVIPETGRQPADGQSKLTLIATPRSADNTPIAGVDVQLIDESGFFEIEGGTTNALGQHRVSITSKQAKEFSVRPVIVVNDTFIKGDPLPLAFEPVDTNTIDLQIIGNISQVADGQSTIILEVTFRDSDGNAVQGANVSFVADPDNITIPKGTTNALGKFRTSVTSTEAGKFTVTPIVNDIMGEGELITFTSIAGQVTDLSVNVVTDNQPATGNDANQINVIARDINGHPVKDVLIKVGLSDPKAIANPSQGKTNENGIFPFEITSNRAGNITFNIVAEGTSATVNGPNSVNFIVATNVTPEKVDLEIFNAPQPADGQAAITLVATPRDASGAPIQGVTVELISDSTTAQIAESSGTSNPLGEFRTTVTNTVAETFKVTAVAEGVPQDNYQPTSVTFFPVGSPVADLQVTVVKNNQSANGTDAVEIHVIARDNSGVAISNVPIVVRMPTGTAAVPDLSFNGNTNERGQQVTNESGFFKTQITSTVAGEIAVTIAIDGTNIAAPPKSVTFTAIGVPTTPTTVDLVVDNNAQPADGTSRITLIVTPRDARGTPIAGVDVELIKDSDNINIDGETGTTNVLGEFRTTAVVTQEIAATPLTEALVVNVTPVAGGIKGQPEPVIFTPVTVPIPATLTLTVSSIATVNEDTPITVLARDERNAAMKNIPIRLRAEPVAGQPDITGSVIFSQFEGQTSEQNGVFETAMKSSQSGKVNVIAEALSREGGQPILSSNSQEVVFQVPGQVVKEVTSISLVTASSQIGSEGNSEGIVITAIVKDKNNNLVEGAEVSFRSDSGEIQPIQVENSAALPGITDGSGRVQARLTTQGSSDNRQITVTATVPTTTGENREDSITIEVVGTKLTISGPTSVIQNGEATFTISLRDSKENGIGGQTVSVKSDLNNILNGSASETTVVTNTNGQAVVTFLASNAGEDTITASKSGANTGNIRVAISDSNFTVTPVPLPPLNLCTLISDNEDVNNNRILDEGEDTNNNGTLDLGCQVPLQLSAGGGQRFNVHWDEGGNNQANEKIILSSSRGNLDKNEVITDFNGDASFVVMPSGDAGNAIITVRAEKADGPSRQFNLKFVATEPRSIIVQANPAVIGTNPVGTDTERSEILAVVRDAESNLVFGKRVNFILDDITGGQLTQGSDITDEFGRASTIYIAGPVPSAAANEQEQGGVKVTATVVDDTTVSNSVRLTVAKNSLFVTIGSGIDLTKDQETGGTRYNVFHTVLVTDANGTPVSDAEVTLSIYPLNYFKGGIEIGEEGGITVNDVVSCPNEDRNRNGLIDSGEDINNNGRLDPGNVITVDKLNLTTGPNGYADFNVVYAIQFAGWVEAEITARATVAGSEDSSIIRFLTVCSEDDKENCPTQNPFGALACDQNG